MQTKYGPASLSHSLFQTFILSHFHYFTLSLFYTFKLYAIKRSLFHTFTKTGVLAVFEMMGGLDFAGIPYSMSLMMRTIAIVNKCWSVRPEG